MKNAVGFQVSPLLVTSIATTLVQMTFDSFLYYCNSFLTGLLASALALPWFVLHAAVIAILQ